MRLFIRLALGLLSTALLACAKETPSPSAPVTASPTAEQANPDRLAPVIAAPDNLTKFKALYFPNKQSYGSLPDGFQELTLESADGLALDAWYREPPSSGPLILYFHGNGGNLSSLGPQFEAFLEAGAGVLAVDYRGFGKSQGTPSEAGLYLDSEASYAKALELGYHPEDIVIYGRSLGGGVATHLAAKRPSSGLVLESSFTSVHDVARRSHGAWAATLVSGYASLSRMPEIDVPTLVIHGTKDETIPSDMGEMLGEVSPQATVWLVEGAGHNNLRKVAGSEYVTRLREFFGTL